MGVAIDNAIRFWKKGPQAVFDIHTHVRTMGKANSEVAQLEDAAKRQCASGGSIAHIATDRVHGLSLKRCQYRRIGEIACVDDNFAGGKTMLCPRLEFCIRPAEMGV